jgi:hypothetical protein
MRAQVAANGFFSAALTEAGEVYTWGSGKVSTRRVSLVPAPVLLRQRQTPSWPALVRWCGTWPSAAL